MYAIRKAHFLRSHILRNRFFIYNWCCRNTVSRLENNRIARTIQTIIVRSSLTQWWNVRVFLKAHKCLMNGDITIVNCEYRRKLKKDEEGDQFFFVDVYQTQTHDRIETRKYNLWNALCLMSLLFNLCFIIFSRLHTYVGVKYLSSYLLVFFRSL